MQFRNNPSIFANWFNNISGEFGAGVKKSYYEISVDTAGKELKINFREEKQVIPGTVDRVESPWVSTLAFNVDTQFARDLLRFLQERVSDTEEEKL